MLKSNYSEIAYLKRANSENIDNITNIDIDKKYNVVCNGVKLSSNSKKTISHKLEKQIDIVSQSIGDLSVNAQLRKQVYASKRSEARKKLKAK